MRVVCHHARLYKGHANQRMQSISIMEVQRVLHMVAGQGENGYASNSKCQEKAISKAKLILQEAISSLHSTIQSESFVVADFGCSSGPNTFMVITGIIDAINQCSHGPDRPLPEIQYFLNDLPGNDFNSIFRSLPSYTNKLAPFHVAAVPGSFYGRLFPKKSIHFMHSSYSLHWLSQIPEGLKENPTLNQESIYIAKASPSIVAKLYWEQYKKDLSLFLKSRSEEIGLGGRMILILLGRTNTDHLKGGYSAVWDLLAMALSAMVSEGKIEEEKLRTFNLPFYAPSIEEVMTIIQKEGSFVVEKQYSFQTYWDAEDDSDEGMIFDNITSGKILAKIIRAVIEPVLSFQFGEAIIEELFSRYAENIANHILTEEAKVANFIISLEKI